jgi:L-amino acid N-acyltransferase YncA
VPAPQSSIKIRRATVADAAAILEIYNHEVQFETSTFDLVPRTLDAQQSWISARSGAFSAIVATMKPTPLLGSVLSANIEIELHTRLRSKTRCT